MSLVSKGPTGSGDEPVVDKSRQASSVESLESDAESIEESTAVPSLPTLRPRFTGYIDHPLRHEKMNKNGIYRPRGRTMTGENGAKFWRDSDDEPWCKNSLSSFIPGYRAGQHAEQFYFSQYQPCITLILENS